MGDNPKSGFEELAKESRLYPQEALLEVKKSKKSLVHWHSQRSANAGEKSSANTGGSKAHCR